MPKQPAISSFFRPINESVPLELTRNEPGSDSEWSDIADNDQEILDSDDEDGFHRIFFKTKKWYRRIFWHLVDLC